MPQSNEERQWAAGEHDDYWPECPHGIALIDGHHDTPCQDCLGHCAHGRPLDGHGISDCDICWPEYDEVEEPHK